jgi:hypothetical protein
MHEHVRTALDRDETITFAAVEPFHSALRHLDLLVVLAVPCHGRAALATLVRPACHGTRGNGNRWHANCPAARISRLGQRVRPTRTPRPGRVPARPGIRSPY